MDYRLEDHTKLVLTPGIEEPRPGFDMYGDENIQSPINPLEALMLELNTGEYAIYTMHEMYDGCHLILYGMYRAALRRTVPGDHQSNGRLRAY